MPPVTAELQVVRSDRLVGKADRAHARGADLVDRLRGIPRDPGLDLRLARGDLSLSGLQHLAVDDLLDLIGLDSRSAPARRRCLAAELDRVFEDSAPPILPNGVRAVPRIRSATSGPFLSGRPWAAGTLRDQRAGKTRVARQCRWRSTYKPFAERRGRLHMVGLLMARRCPEEFSALPGAGRRRGRLSSRVDPVAPRAPSGCWSSGSASPGSSTRSDCGWPPRWWSARRGRYEARRSPGRCPGGRRPGRPSAGGGAGQGTVLASYRFDRFKSPRLDDRRRPRLERLADRRRGADAAVTARPRESARSPPRPPTGRASFRACPSNVVTPSYLADRARRSPTLTGPSRSRRSAARRSRNGAWAALAAVARAAPRSRS